MVLPARSGRAPSMCGASAGGAFAWVMIFSGLVLTKPIAKPGRAGLYQVPMRRTQRRRTRRPPAWNHRALSVPIGSDHRDLVFVVPGGEKAAENPAKEASNGTLQKADEARLRKASTEP